jgi:hypothetical protein
MKLIRNIHRFLSIERLLNQLLLPQHLLIPSLPLTRLLLQRIQQCPLVVVDYVLVIVQRIAVLVVGSLIPQVHLVLLLYVLSPQLVLKQVALVYLTFLVQRGGLIFVLPGEPLAGQVVTL